MASTYSTNLKLELIGTGEQSGVWGTTTNTNMGTAIEQAIVGKGSPVFSTDADLTLTLSNSSAAQTARAFVLNVTSGVSLTTTRNLVVPTIEKPYVVMNNTTGGQSIVVKTAAGSGITVPNGGQVFLYVDGTNVIQMLDAFGDLTYTGTLTGGTGVVNLGSGQFVKDASGNVGLGVTPSAWSGGKGFQVERASVFGVASLGGFASNLYLADAGANYRCIANGTVALYLQNVAGDHRWSVGSGTAGNIVSPTIGMTLDASGRLSNSASSSNVASFNGTGGSGGYVTFENSAVVYGDIGTANQIVSGGSVSDFGINARGARNLIFGTNNAERVRIDTSGNLTPGGDNTQTNGSGAKRWSVIYAGTGTINTSDAREKTDVRVMAADEIEAAKALSKEIGVYQFLDSVAAKGDKARHHIGMTVQRAIEIMKHHGLDPFSYGFICYDKWGEETKEHPAVEAREAVEAKDAVLDDEGNVIEPAVEAQPAIKAKDAWTEVTQQAGDRYSFRYDQLTLFIARGIDARLAALESA